MATKGLSPRGRGNRARVEVDVSSVGSIPAWAGKPLSGGVSNYVAGVYPRVGGETLGVGCWP